MLVLTRRAGESLDFPGLGIRVTVARIQDGRVRLGIEAPADVKVLRTELKDRIAQEGAKRKDFGGK